MKSTSTLLGLTIFYAIVFLFSALEPSSRAVWFAEIIPAIGILIAIWAISIRYQFSNTAYLLMFIWLCLHTIGAKYTFAEVPFDWFNNLIGSERNNFDRVAHFAIGLYAYPIAEYLIRNKNSTLLFHAGLRCLPLCLWLQATKSLSGGMPNWLVAMKALPS